MISESPAYSRWRCPPTSAGFRSPTTQIYRVALERLRVEPDAVMFFDDVAANVARRRHWNRSFQVLVAPTMFASVWHRNGYFEAPRKLSPLAWHMSPTIFSTVWLRHRSRIGGGRLARWDIPGPEHHRVKFSRRHGEVL